MAGQGKLPWLVVGGVVVAIGAATWFIRNGDAPAPAATPAPVAAAPAPAGDAPPAGAAPRTQRPPRDAAERVAAVTERRAQRREEYARRTEEMRKNAEKTFAAEKVDAAWASGKERELDAVAGQEVFATANATPKRLQVECRSSMCRIDSDFGSMGQAEDWLLMYMSSVGSTMPNSVVTRTPNPDGSASIRIYGRGR